MRQTVGEDSVRDRRNRGRQTRRQGAASLRSNRPQPRRPEPDQYPGPAHDWVAAEASELASVCEARTGDALAGES